MQHVRPDGRRVTGVVELRGLEPLILTLAADQLIPRPRSMARVSSRRRPGVPGQAGAFGTAMWCVSRSFGDTGHRTAISAKRSAPRTANLAVACLVDAGLDVRGLRIPVEDCRDVGGVLVLAVGAAV
jgi:hypothetical protein